MTIVDLNLLIYAVNADSPHHATALAWWQKQLSGDETIGLPWAVTCGFLRITTLKRLFPNPLSVKEALTIINEWLEQPIVVSVNPGEAHWKILSGLLEKNGTGGNLTTDAHLAALAIEYGSTLCSFDNDFARFQPDLKFFNPLK